MSKKRDTSKEAYMDILDRWYPYQSDGQLDVELREAMTWAVSYIDQLEEEIYSMRLSMGDV